MHPPKKHNNPLPKRKMIEFEIHAKLWFEPDENIDVVDYLDHLREIGEAEIVDVKVVEKDL